LTPFKAKRNLSETDLFRGVAGITKLSGGLFKAGINRWAGKDDFNGNINFGFGTQLWSEEQWRWFIDWCLLHKINGFDLCIYGYWPFKFPGYPEITLANIPVKTYDPQTEKTSIVRTTHPDMEREFLPALIGYAQTRGIRVNARIGLNTFNGGYAREHSEARQCFSGPQGVIYWISAIMQPANTCMIHCGESCRWGLTA